MIAAVFWIAAAVWIMASLRFVLYVNVCHFRKAGWTWLVMLGACIAMAVVVVK